MNTRTKSKKPEIERLQSRTTNGQSQRDTIPSKVKSARNTVETSTPARNTVETSTPVNRLRVKYAGAFLILLAIEVLIALYVHDAIIRPYIGDVLVVIVLYLGARAVRPTGIKLLPLYIFIFAALVECLQLAGLVRLINVENNTFLRILIGSVFDVKDIIGYGVGCILTGIYELVYVNPLKKNSGISEHRDQ